MAEEPFSYKITQVRSGMYGIQYVGYMPEGDRGHLARTEEIFTTSTGPLGLYYEVPNMTGFHRSQLGLHGDVFARHRARLAGLAVIGARAAIRFGAITVGLIARINVQHFDTRAEALDWLDSVVPRAKR